MQCFFHMRTRDQKVVDSVGKNLPTLNAAYEHSLHLINRTLKFVDAPYKERWMIEVCSPADRVLMVVLFPAAPSENWVGRMFEDYITRPPSWSDLSTTDAR
jgi:hypothetical protein